MATDRDCPLCPRLVALRTRLRAEHDSAADPWHNAPVPAFGPIEARLLIVGLAPGLRGANRTGRPFTGDYAGTLLYATLKRHGFATGDYDARPDDGLALNDCRIVNAVRCLPPENKPVAAEVNACRPFLAAEIAAMPRLAAICTLGGIAHGATLRTLGRRRAEAPFRHGVLHDLGDGRVLAPSYHCSRYNTNTGRLTETMFDAVFAALRAYLDRIEG